MITETVPVSGMVIGQLGLSSGCNSTKGPFPAHGLITTTRLEPVMVTEAVPGVPTGLPSMIDKVWFITVTAPSKSVSPGLGAAERVKEPEPVPAGPAVMVSQLAFETAVQGQPASVVTSRV